MIYWLVYDILGLENKIALFSYITFRSFMAALTVLVMAYFLYPRYIKWLKKIGVGEAAKLDAPKAHLLKAGTPTMGGVMIVITIVISTLLWARIDNIYVILAILFLSLFAVIGFFDDLIKLKFKKKRDSFIKNNREEWLKKHEESKNSMILSEENHHKQMENFLELLSEFLDKKFEIEELYQHMEAQLRADIQDDLKDDIYQLYFKRDKKTLLKKMREVWIESGKSYDSWDRFLLSKNLSKDDLKPLQKDIIEYFDRKFEFKFQEKRYLEEVVDNIYRWVSMPYALQELEHQKKKWSRNFFKKEKEKRTFVKDIDGLRGSFRLVLEFLIAGLLLFILVTQTNYSTILQVPFLKNVNLDLGAAYLFFGMVVIVAFANAVNLTDGLDGLAIGPIMVAMFAVSIFTYVAGHTGLATYLNITYIEGMGELTVFTVSVVAAGMGFLWFNTYPAQIFMGDVGSLGLGASFGSLVVMSKTELISLILGGIFFIEALSVIIQVGVYKTKKVRVFRMAPIHHHFEKMGLHENKIIVRFWLFAIILAMISLATLKLR